MPACEHCLLEFPEREAVYQTIDGHQKVFCCYGCLGIYRLIHDEGLGGFYENRKWGEAGIPAYAYGMGPPVQPDTSPFTRYVRDSDSSKEIDLYIDGIRCSSCVWLNEKILMRTEGVRYARVNYATHKARIRWDPEATGLDNILKRILSIGYTPKPYSESERMAAQRSERRELLVRLGTAGFLSCQLMLYSTALYAGYFQGIDVKTRFLLQIIAALVTLPVIFYSGMPFIKGALGGLRHFRFNMDSLIAVGAVSSFLYSVYEMCSGGQVYFDTAAMIVTLILLGRYIEAAAKGKASETMERLAQLAPESATMLTPAAVQGLYERQTVPVASLKQDDLVEVKPGEKVPIDGIVIGGGSEADESLLTGESGPVLKMPGAEVIGGSMNLSGALVVRVGRTGEDTLLAGIIRAVEDAQARKPRLQELADRAAGIFVPAILVLAAAAVAFHLARGQSPGHSLMTGVSVIVIACPCSLGLATQLAILVFSTLASSKGVLVKAGNVVEKTAGLTHVLFDKTGTISTGKSALKRVIVVDSSLSEEYIARLASSVESLSEHSIGHAICGRTGAKKFFPVSGFRAFPGKGVEGVVEGRRIIIGNQALMEESGVPVTGINEAALAAREDSEKEGDTLVYMAWGGEVRALMVISDTLRPEAARAVAEIKKMHCPVGVISGDNDAAARAVARQVGIESVLSGMTPAGKKEYITYLQGGGLKGGRPRIMMVGDGINDAPALTEASIGIAMGRGTDIALESADAILMRDDLTLVPYFIALSRRTFSIMKQNIFWSFFYNSIAVPLAVAGMLHPIAAAGAMAASSLFVVGNSLRIRRFQ